MNDKEIKKKYTSYQRRVNIEYIHAKTGINKDIIAKVLEADEQYLDELLSAFDYK